MTPVTSFHTHNLAIEVPRQFLVMLADQMADPEKWAYMLREHARTIRKQLARLDRARGKGQGPPVRPNETRAKKT